MQRLIMQDLLNWKVKANRKPLILKGVRQTGKTYSLKQFGKQQFSASHYINFENNLKAHALFQKSFDPNQILVDLSFLLQTVIDVENDLIIFDEIQACPSALTSLKYFAEQLPSLAVCCAGSLLGLHLGESSFPVGKVDVLNMRPLCFVEFLEASGEQQALEILSQPSPSISEVIHDYLWQRLKYYFVTGGLPEVVQVYLDKRDDLYSALTEVRKKQDELIFGYYADIAKHSGKANAMHIDRTWRSVPTQLAQSQEKNSSRFQFKGILPGIDRYQRLANVIDWLHSAELIIKVPIVEHIELPLSAYTEESRFKLYMFDIGILGALAGLNPQVILDYDYGTYKGYFAENYVASEFIAKNYHHLYSWQHQRSEVEFLLPYQGIVIPVEVKSGWVTRSQSLTKYTHKYHPSMRATLSAKPLLINKVEHYCNCPLYMTHWFPELVMSE